MHPAVARSYTFCEALARRTAGNFYPAFRVLPTRQRLAMCALYAFLRLTDDLGDDPAPLDDRADRLRRWRLDFDRACHGDFTHPIHPALQHTIQQYDIPRGYLDAALDGVEMDLAPVAYRTFDDLRLYCYRVASVVGLACIHIWGCPHERAHAFAEQAGIAFQLTNILRDLREDAARGRVYLPGEDLERFGCDPVAFATGRRDAGYREMMRFQVQRARGFYDASWPLVNLLPSAGRAVFLVMARTYRGLLDAIEGRDYDVFTCRVSLSRWRKLLLVMTALPVRYGWA